MTREVDGEALDVVVIQTRCVPQEVQQYALGGALNIWLEGDNCVFVQPKGCVRRFLTELCGRALAPESKAELDAFIKVARSVPIDKGHVFERALACELTLVGTRFYELVARKAGRSLTCDPLVFAQPFTYEARIDAADWDNPLLLHRVLCVKEDPLHVGQRKVDVGFPVYIQGARWKVLCELKSVQDQNTLWRMCYAFFMLAREWDSCSIAIFVSACQFTDHEPRQAKVGSGLSAFDSRQLVLDMLRAEDSRVIIIEGEELQAAAIIPIIQLARAGGLPPPETNVSAITDAVSDLYIGPSPVKP